MKTVAIITAAGYGRRMGQPKQFLEIEGKPILARTIAVFEQTKIIDEIIVVVNQEDVERVKKFKYKKLKQVVAGGKERQDSVYNGLRALPADTEIVAIHDGARPFISPEIIEQSVDEALEVGAVVVGVPVKDTIKKVASSQVVSSQDRNELWAAQTPQVFKKDIILKAYEAQAQAQVTDDAMLVEKLGIPVKMVLGSYQNIKITTPSDLQMAQGILKGGKR
ncbi:MAG: 2-C-methyl-D-erythritol 4-phosphate cytidylyltransferase [Candidatus Margulisbacteria bacterium]|nr:2-C-methyl-D-erythritol 4-phosphate cytidylyltransferase [Candidatus Margulisiibacteriota bacterium]